MRARMTSIRSLFLAVTVVFQGTLLSERQAAAATTHYVDNVRDCAGLVPCLRTITDAVTAAVPYDFIEVFPGVYGEAVVFDETKNNIVLRAHSASNLPVIVAPGEDSAVTLLAPGVEVRNFVLEGGVKVVGADLRRDLATDAVIHGNLVNGGIAFQRCHRSVVTKNSVLGGGISAVGVPFSSSGHFCLVEGNTVYGGSIQIGNSDHEINGNVVRRNVVRGGGISLHGEGPRGNTVESNRVYGGGIRLFGVSVVDENVIRHNVVRGGGIELARGPGGSPIGGNTIESNFVSGSAGDGIAVRSLWGGSTLIRKNTSVENAGCDVNDTALYSPRNTWRKNRFGTQCGAATQ